MRPQAPPLAAAPDGVLLPGVEVEIGGLWQHPAFNGLRGVVRSYDPGAGCYVVALRCEAGEQAAKVSPANLAPVAAPRPPPAAGAAGAADAAGAPLAAAARGAAAHRAEEEECAAGREGREGAADGPPGGQGAREAEQRAQAAERRALEAERRALAAEQRAREAEERARQSEQRAREGEAAMRAHVARLVAENEQVQKQARAAKEAFTERLGGLELQRDADAAAWGGRDDKGMCEAQLAALDSEKKQFRQEATAIFKTMEDFLKSQLHGLEQNRTQFQQYLANSAQAKEADEDVHEAQLSTLESEREQFRQEASIIFNFMEHTLKSQLHGLELDRGRLQQQLAASAQDREVDEDLLDAQPSPPESQKEQPRQGASDGSEAQQKQLGGCGQELEAATAA